MMKSYPLKCLLVIVLLYKCGFISCQDIVSKTSNVCENDVQCPDNAFCKFVDGGKGLCICKEKYVIHPINATHRECLRVGDNLGDSCKYNIQCEYSFGSYSHCVGNKCECKPDGHADDGRCFYTAKLGEGCVSNHNCYLGPPVDSSKEAFCIRGVCVCNFLHRPRDSGTRCLKDAMLGDKCEDDEHCTNENSRCHDVCRCIDGYIVHSSEDRCVKAATNIGDTCEINGQCTKNLNGTLCLGQKCVCDQGYHMKNGRCWNTRISGQRCAHDQECLTDENGQGQCLEGTCTCQGCGPYRNRSSILEPKNVIISIFILLLIIFKEESRFYI